MHFSLDEILSIHIGHRGLDSQVIPFSSSSSPYDEALSLVEIPLLPISVLYKSYQLGIKGHWANKLLQQNWPHFSWKSIFQKMFSLSKWVDLGWELANSINTSSFIRVTSVSKELGTTYFCKIQRLQKCPVNQPCKARFQSPISSLLLRKSCSFFLIPWVKSFAFGRTHFWIGSLTAPFQFPCIFH